MNLVTISTIYKGAGGQVLVKQETIEGDQEINIEPVELPIGATDIEITLTIDYTKMKAWAMGVTKAPGQTGAANLTATADVKTNSSSSPTQTFGISNTNGKSWSTGDGTNPITSNITALFIDNTGTGKILFAFRCVLDSTPGI